MRTYLPQNVLRLWRCTTRRMARNGLNLRTGSRVTRAKTNGVVSFAVATATIWTSSRKIGACVTFYFGVCVCVFAAPSSCCCEYCNPRLESLKSKPQLTKAHPHSRSLRSTFLCDVTFVCLSNLLLSWCCRWLVVGLARMRPAWTKLFTSTSRRTISKASKHTTTTELKLLLFAISHFPRN